MFLILDHSRWYEQLRLRSIRRARDYTLSGGKGSISQPQNRNRRLSTLAECERVLLEVRQNCFVTASIRPSSPQVQSEQVDCPNTIQFSE
jgi:hypothetical protein